MQVKVHLLAFGNEGEIRLVDVPDRSTELILDDDLLDLAFHYGQNDFQPLPHPSVSMGDVIELGDGKLFRVQAMGFKQLSPAEFALLKALPRRDRAFHEFN